MAELRNINAIKGGFGRWRRALRRRLLEPLMVRNRALREALLNALAARGHLIYCRLPEGSFFVDPSDRVIASWLMWHGGWQRAEIERAVSILRKAGRATGRGVFIDVGANIGTHTVYALKSGQFERAIAFEPEPRNAMLLAMNIAANDCAARIICVNKAVGDAAGIETLHIHPRNRGAHSLNAPPSLDGLERVEVPVVRLDAALAEFQISASDIGLVWIDVEGHEPEVIAGLGDLLGRVPLAIEYAPRRYDERRGDTLRAALQRDYRKFARLDIDNAPEQPMSELTSLQTDVDIIVY